MKRISWGAVHPTRKPLKGVYAFCNWVGQWNYGRYLRRKQFLSLLYGLRGGIGLGLGSGLELAPTKNKKKCCS